MMSMWVDFKALRERIDLAAVLKHYGVDLKRKGRGQAQGYCPLPNHRARTAGEKPRSPSFAVSFVKGAFHCFSCHAHGNVLDFVAYMEGLDPSNGGNIRKARRQPQRLQRPAHRRIAFEIILLANELFR